MKLVGKLNPYAAKDHVPVPNPYAAKDHVTHHRLGLGDTEYLCGRGVNRDRFRGTHRTAYDTNDLTCNRCQRVVATMRSTPQGRKLLGLV